MTQETPNVRRSRTFLCVLCPQRFSRAEHLHRHQRSHRGEKPFKCHDCGLSSGRKDVILRHRRTFHPDSLPKLEPSPPNTQDSANSNILNSCSTEEYTSNLELVGGESVIGTSHGSEKRTSSEGSRWTQSFPNELPLLDNSIVNDSTIDYMSLDFLEDWIFPQTSPLFDIEANQSPLDIGDEPSDPAISNLNYKNEPDAHDHDSILVSEADMQKFTSNLNTLLVHDGGIDALDLPTRYGAVRYLRAYYQNFAEHTPIVPMQTFNISSTHPILVLTMLSVGAMHTNEADIGHIYRKFTLKALERQSSSKHATTSDPEAWELQSRLILCHCGLFCSGNALKYESIQSFQALSERIQKAIQSVGHLPSNTWTQWIYRETIIRCISWWIITAAVLLSDEGQVSVNFQHIAPDIPLPVSEEEWKASSQSWQGFNIRYSQPYMISAALQDLFAGQKIKHNVSAFGLLTLIAALQGYICSSESLLTFMPSGTMHENIKCMEKALKLWEEKWKAHPHSGHQLPSIHGPIMVDALAILNSAYYHLYASSQLRWMKSFIQSKLSQIEIDETFPLAKSPYLETGLIRAINSLRLRARYGIKFLNRTGGLSFAPYLMLSGYEGGLLVSWYLICKKIGRSNNGDFPNLPTLINETTIELRKSGYKGLDSPAVLLQGYEDLLGGAWVWQGAYVLEENFARLRLWFSTIPNNNGKVN